MSRAITLAGFEATFRGNPDPWATFTARDEALKRRAILHALGPGRHGRLLELACGNGSNSVALARHALRLDATDGAPTAVALTARALGDHPRATAIRLVLPGRFPHRRYDAIVVAEVLYYLTPRDLTALARQIAATLRPGGRLVLAHHHIRFRDVAQHPATVHARLLAALGRKACIDVGYRTACWRVTGYAVA
ncbi:methyltransferase [Sphingomonas sp. Leaf407]|uniref:class I SAM-dependent methyltransferase n=1 Tax=unclassified Sphingomonas TaxID=196159 RepID=UPI0006FA66DD|nr:MULTISPECIES: class I SAM-dependent methyltransferase [unclassified Sphingomonas]KQN37442.1 methyltransferase [Sphingomonas sp. Leaf42]KQT27810.1 methyltransferase [Sphingomonas sp. Leaf407]